MLAGTLVLGCGEQQSPTAPAAPLNPSFSAEVDRSPAPFGFAFGGDGRILVIGLTIEDLLAICSNNEPNIDLLDQLAVTRPDQSIKLLLRGKDVNVFVLDSPTSVPCDELLDVPRFTGTARVLYTDSDLDLSGHGADASMIQVTGTVTDESGQLYHLVALNHQVVDPSNTSFDNFQKIRLTPIGR